jgi:maltose alpha-D-glucosyltransferase/alpha-amylase
MQWTPYHHGGFSSAPPRKFVRPINSGGDYGFEKINVSSQRADPDSLLNWIASLMRTRRECGEIGVGRWEALDTGDDAVLGVRYEVDDCAIVVFNNLSRQRRTIKVDLSEEELRTATDLFCDRRYEPLTDGESRMRIEGLGYRWLRVRGIY